MSPPRIASSGSPFDQHLVRAARTESPAEGAEARAIAALGLSPGLAAPVGSLAREAPRLPLRWIAAFKAVAVGVAVVLGTAVAVEFVRGPETPTRAGPPLGSIPVFTRLEASGVPEILPPSAAPAPATSSMGEARSPSAAHARHHASTPSTGSLASASTTATATMNERPPLAAEIALVEQAKRALTANEAGVALGVLDAYGSAFPHGILAEEAGVLRVQALARTGDTAGARVLARKILAADPHAVLAPQLRGVADGPSNHDPTPPLSGAP